jgi:predicted DNA-binding transcriptional regulator AlpA
MTAKASPLAPPDPRYQLAAELHVMSEREAARFLDNMSPRSLQRYRLAGTGPRYIRLGPRCVRYRRSDLQTWLDARVYESTSADPHAAKAGGWHKRKRPELAAA